MYLLESYSAILRAHEQDVSHHANVWDVSSHWLAKQISMLIPPILENNN